MSLSLSHSLSLSISRSLSLSLSLSQHVFVSGEHEQAQAQRFKTCDCFVLANSDISYTFVGSGLCRRVQSLSLLVSADSSEPVPRRECPNHGNWSFFCNPFGARVLSGVILPLGWDKTPQSHGARLHEDMAAPHWEAGDAHFDGRLGCGR